MSRSFEGVLAVQLRDAKREQGPTSVSQAIATYSMIRNRMAAKEKLEAMLNVALRVPSIMLLDVLYRWDVSSFFQQIQRSSLNNNPLFQYKYLALNMHYVGYILSVVLLTLPRQHLVQLYLYFLTALLLYAGHQISRMYLLPPTRYMIVIVFAAQGMHGICLATNLLFEGSPVFVQE
ncbi:hypothetical protein JD844_012362 [Phrynosoma platyrhinos]|uniref:TRC8-like N-terminal domain-containing protein n=1 Tax=Phrynosoma platyrhinos TaxID=52577 RepID=A0ABQ7TJE8_PHRPL|nr:hypothetical protein JD844_012362 [Phrynosoma platyrhinos]